MRIAVVGLGHIGLALAVQYAGRGHDVVGCDTAEWVVDAVNRGQAPHPDEPEIVRRVPELVAAGRLSATTDDTEGVRGADAVVVIVPLAVDDSRRIDYRAIDAATRDVARGIDPNTLVVYETTLPVGTTRRRFGPMLEAGSGLQLDRDLFLAFSPERVLIGRVLLDLQRYPKIVGGTSEPSTRRAIDFYRAVLEDDTELCAVSSAEAAEMTKLAETTYRDVNIALANEYARYAARHGVDIGEVIEAANSQPYSHVHQPGVGVGGHCIPVYPYFLFSDDPEMRLPPLAREINDGMARYAVDLIEQRLGSLDGEAVLVLGVSYRGDVRQDAFSSAFRLRDELLAAGARVYGHDPLYDGDHLQRLGFVPYALDDPQPVAVAILQAAHSVYRQLDVASLPGLRLFVDGRNALDRARLATSGVEYVGIGR